MAVVRNATGAPRGRIVSHVGTRAMPAEGHSGGRYFNVRAIPQRLHGFLMSGVFKPLSGPAPSKAEPLSPWSYALLQAPYGLHVATAAYGYGLSQKDIKQLWAVSKQLIHELKLVGIDPVSDVGIDWFFKDYSRWNFPRDIELRMLAETLSNIPADKFMAAARKVEAANEERYELSPSFVRRVGQLFHGPSWWLLFKANATQWGAEGLTADSYAFAGDMDNARRYYRKEAMNSMKRAQLLLYFNKGEISRGEFEFARFQLAMAVGTFESAAESFEKAGSVKNMLWAKTLAQRTRNMIDSVGPKPGEEGRGSKRMSFMEFMGEALMAVSGGEDQPDAELSDYARYAETGSRDGMRRFVERTADVMGVSEDEVLTALRAGGPIGDKLEDWGEGISTAAEAFGSTPKEVLRTIWESGSALYARIEVLLDKDVRLMENLRTLAREYR